MSGAASSTAQNFDASWILQNDLRWFDLIAFKRKQTNSYAKIKAVSLTILGTGEPLLSEQCRMRHV